MILEVDGKPFEVKDRREPGVFSWYEGYKMSDPNGWRLPTIKELGEMYEHQDKIDFGIYNYWSRDRCSDDSAMLLSFNTGQQYDYPKKDQFSVWLVRDVEPEKSKTGYYWSADLRIVWNGETIEFGTDDYPEGRRITVDISIYQASDVIDALSKILDDYFRGKFSEEETTE